MDMRSVRAYALEPGKGWTYNYGIDFTVKAGELRHHIGLALIEYTTHSGEEPPDHTHATEDEVFYVLSGALAFRCGAETFDVETGGFMFLPRGVEHGYTIRGDADVRLLVVTAPTQDGGRRGWGGFVSDLERDGELRASPDRSG